MRSDYALYGVAIVCFIIAIVAGALMANSIPGYTLEGFLGIAMITIFLVLGIISATVGYSTRPRAIIPPTQPIPSTPSTRAPAPETPPPPAPTPPQPIEEITPEPPPTAPPTPPQPVETVVIPPAEPEQPVIVAEEETPKEKPTRRRRKKAQ